MNTFNEDDRVTGLYFGRAYTGTVVHILPCFDHTDYFVESDDQTMGLDHGHVVIQVPPIRQSKTTMRYILPDNKLPVRESDNDYTHLDTNTYPFDFEEYTPMNTTISMFEADTEVNPQTAMFAAPASTEVTAMFNGSGILEISFATRLTDADVKQYNYGICSQVGKIARAERYTEVNGNTTMVITLRPNAAKYAFDIRTAAKAYTEGFLMRLTACDTKPAQVSMF